MKRISWKVLKKNRFFYVMLIPIAVYFILFNYYPLVLGFVNSFQDVKLLGNTAFAGLNNYKKVTASPFYQQAFVNALIVNVGTFLLQFVWGLALAVLINEMRHKFSKSLVQSVTYLPNLLSWSVVGGIWITILSPSGMVNGILQKMLGKDFRRIAFMAESAWARPIFIFTGAWKTAGYTAVLFLAAIVGIDPNLYEAATIDGASRFQQISHIALPSLVPTMKVVTVLGTMGILRNFDQVFIMGNSNIFDKIRNLLMLIYVDGITKFKIGLSTAAATMVLLVTLVISFIVRKLLKYDEAYD